MVLRDSNFAGGKRALNSVITSKTTMSMTAWASSGDTTFTMLMSCVLVSSMIRCCSTTCEGSPGSQTGVMVVPVPVSPTSPWQPSKSAAQSGSTRAGHRVETEERLANRIEEPPTEGDA